MVCAFLEKKVHSLSVAPEPLAIWNKKLEGLESELFYRTVYLSFCSPRAYIRVVLFRKNSEAGFWHILWWSTVVRCRWLSVNAFCSRVVLCRYILPNMLVFEYCSLSPESSIIESCLFTVSFIRLISLVLLVHVHRSFDL